MIIENILDLLIKTAVKQSVKKISAAKRCDDRNSHKNHTK